MRAEGEQDGRGDESGWAKCRWRAVVAVAKDRIGGGLDSRGVARAGDRGVCEGQRQRWRRSGLSGVEKALEAEEWREQEIDVEGNSSSGGQEDRRRNNQRREGAGGDVGVGLERESRARACE